MEEWKRIRIMWIYIDSRKSKNKKIEMLVLWKWVLEMGCVKFCIIIIRDSYIIIESSVWEVNWNY